MADERHEELAQVHRLVVRFGNELLQDGFTSVPNLVLTHYAALGISPAEMMFSIHVWQYWWTEKDPYPALQTIADRMSVTRRQVRNYTQSLKAKGYLIVNERTDRVLGQLTSEYDFGPLLDAVLFVRGLLKKLSPLAPRAQQVVLARSLGQVLGREGEDEIRAAADELIEQLRPAAPLLAHALHEEREAIAALKIPRVQPRTVPRKRDSASPRNNPSEGGRKDSYRAPRNAISSEEYIDQADEDSNNTHREENEGIPSTGFESFALTRQTREPYGFSKKDASDETLRQSKRPRTSGMTAVGQIVARRGGAAPPGAREVAPEGRRMAPEAALGSPNGLTGSSDRPPPYRAPDGASSDAPDGTGSGGGRGQRRPPPPKLPPYLEDLVLRYSQELHDEEHLAQNLGQAGRLWKASGWSETAFSQALTEAKAITLKRDIKKRATIGGEVGARNKMPYYFKVLRDLVGLKDREESSGGVGT